MALPHELPLPVCGELQHPPLYQYQPEDAHIAESKQLLGVLHPEVVLVTQAVPLQYWPEGHEEVEVEEQPLAGVVEQE